ncbi:MAG: LysR family transcriptional regulator [Anaerostipes sp.]|jgi:DNA-binding transcriptional LysR family regulator|nr:LysR family transcriptional regulator [Anaerostipes sp.]
MEIKNLITFLTILQEGTFSKAANKLGYTQSTITFQMRQLEEELGVTLFEKVGRKMMLSKAGESVTPYIKEVLASLDRLKDSQHNLQESQGSLSIAMAETQICYHMPQILKEFRKQAPNAKLMLRSMNCYEIRDALIEGSVDLGIFYDEVGDSIDSLKIYPFEEVSMTLIASKGTKKLYNDFITPNQRLNIPFIIDEPDCIFRQIFEQYLKEKKIILDHTIELWSIPTIKNLVMNDVGISYLPTFTVQKELNDQTLCAIETSLDDLRITAVCAHHRNKWVSPLMKLFIDLVTKST